MSEADRTTEGAHHRIGDYEILGVLGVGGMGRVYKVRNILSDRIEAMKVLLPNLEEQQEFADRFLREIKLLAVLTHPNITALHTALTVGDHLVMVMEYVEGVTLATRLEVGPIPIAEVLNCMEQVLDGLSYAHHQHVIHRDIKPANMMLTPENIVKIMDFGIARSDRDRRLTMTGVISGSLYYMSPEQVTGKAIDERSDLYSLGVSLYEMVTGQRPFRDDSDFSVMAAHLQQTPRAPIEICSNLPPGLNELILQAMAKDPTRRFQTADAFRSALDKVRRRLAEPQPAVQIAAATNSPAGAATSLFQTSVPSVSPQECIDLPERQQKQTPVVPDLERQPTVMRPAHRGFYMTAGALIVVAVLFGVGIYWPHSSKPVKAGGEKPPAVPAQPDRQNPSQVSNASNPGGSEPSETPQVSPPENESGGSPQGNSATPTVAKVVVPQQEGRRVRPIPDPASNRADAHELLALQQQEDKLDSRAGAVNETLDHMRQRQSADGWPLRGDLASAQSLMNTDLKRARTALQSKDATSAKGYLGSAETELAKLEKILNLEVKP